MKKKILVVVSLLIVVALLTTGAFAYFTSGPKTASGHIQSGTLALKIAGVVPSAACPGDSAFGDTANLWDLSNMAPGDIVTGKLCMKNTGTLPIAQVAFNWSGMSNDLASHIFVTHLVNSVSGDEINAYIAAYGGSDGKMSLAELNAENYGWSLPPYSGVLDEYWVGARPIFLPVADTEWVEYTFQFDPLAGNEFQGLGFDYTLTITGLQNAVY
jgi:hypothetical protein